MIPFIRLTTAVRELALQYPDAVNAHPMYVVRGEPCCLIGRALALAGADQPPLRYNLTAIGMVPLWELGIDPTPDGQLRRWLGAVQHACDRNGLPWAAALVMADDLHPLWGGIGI